MNKVALLNRITQKIEKDKDWKDCKAITELSRLLTLNIEEGQGSEPKILFLNAINVIAYEMKGLNQGDIDREQWQSLFNQVTTAWRNYFIENETSIEPLIETVDKVLEFYWRLKNV